MANSLYLKTDFFAVALYREAVALRLSGIDKKILIMLPLCKDDYLSSVNYGFSLTVCGLRELQLIKTAAERIKKNAFLHIKINSGMNRLGLDSLEELDAALKIIKKSGYLVCEGIYSHFSDNTDKEFTACQFDNFSKFYSLCKCYFPSVISHISASGGILLSQKYHLDMVRCGIMLYGYTPYKTNKISLKPVLSVKTKVLACRKLEKYSHSGYGAYRLEDDGYISVARAGYGDGILRASKGYINNLCMDLSFISGKHAPFSEIPLLNDNLNADALAENCGTISYEILTNITKRLNIIYE